ncbi:cytochrome b-c1 complex subunit 6, mitochondrial-like [Corticium candelabrum]|uniref:cytochrome b-c1 complex subunit 6, mitochondrial-like n=1 Tax=Corticium candelabrum TaxID=121492 RepID=UPI002E2767A5|nr:cytochrome b-c1 complex subunit 6, mitochondrial-like [Corticium candelabrum]
MNIMTDSEEMTTVTEEEESSVTDDPLDDSVVEDAGGDGDEEEEEDIEDPQEIIREKCRETKKCASLRDKLNTCNERVLSRKRTEETCEEELFDFVHCVDHCVAKTLFSKLK